MSKTILALDGDQILFAWVDGFIAYAIKAGHHLNLNSSFSTYSMHTWFTNMSENQFKLLVVEYNSHEHPRLLPHAVHLPNIKQKYHVCVISSYTDCRETKATRLNILNALDITDVYILGLGDSKYDILCEIGNGNGQNIFVDDSPKHIQEGIDAGWKVATIRYPYNQGLDGVRYLDSLGELL